MQQAPKLSRLFLIAIPFLYLVLGATHCSASIRANELILPSGFIDSGFAIGDFDGDGRLDDVVLVRVTPISPSHAVYSISIHMGSGVTQNVSITGPLGVVQILQRDVTGNGTPDLVLAAPWMDHPLAVLINMDNSSGTFFAADPTDFLSPNGSQPAADLEPASKLRADGAALSTKRFVPLEREFVGMLSAPRPCSSSPIGSNRSRKHLLVLSSVSDRAPPCFSNIS